MGIAENFCDPKFPMVIADNYKKFSQSQLVILSQVRCYRKEFLKIARPEDTVEKFKKAKKYWNGFCIQGARTKSKTLDEFISVCEDYEAKKNNSLSDKDFDRLDKIINNKVQTSGKKSSEDRPGHDYSGRSENSELKPIIYEVPVEDVIELPCEIEFLSQELKEKIVLSVAKDLDIMSYKTIFDPDDKGLGIRVQSDQLVRFVLSKFFEAVDRVKLSVSVLNEWNQK